jgi:hypothetical protein
VSLEIILKARRGGDDSSIQAEKDAACDDVLEAVLSSQLKSNVLTWCKSVGEDRTGAEDPIGLLVSFGHAAKQRTKAPRVFGAMFNKVQLDFALDLHGIDDCKHVDDVINGLLHSHLQVYIDYQVAQRKLKTNRVIVEILDLGVPEEGAQNANCLPKSQVWRGDILPNA